MTASILRGSHTPLQIMLVRYEAKPATSSHRPIVEDRPVIDPFMAEAAFPRLLCYDYKVPPSPFSFWRSQKYLILLEQP